MGERLAQGNAAVALLANAIATGAALQAERRHTDAVYQEFPWRSDSVDVVQSRVLRLRVSILLRVE
jgi:hypothetical protein